jgi:hypothetical protein
MSTDDALGQTETEEQQRRRLHASECAELLKRQFSNSEAYDKAILALSSGFLALSLSQCVEIVRPRLHHLPSLREPNRAVVRRPDLVPLGVCQLQLDQIRVPPLLV